MVITLYMWWWWCVGSWWWRRDVCRRSRSQLSAAASRRPPPTLVRHARPRRAHLLGRGTPTRAHSPHSCTLTPDTPITYSLHPRSSFALSYIYICFRHITSPGPPDFAMWRTSTHARMRNPVATRMFVISFLFCF